MSAARFNLEVDRGASMYRLLQIIGAPAGTTFRLYILAGIYDETPLVEFTSVPQTSDTGVLMTLELPASATTGGSLPLDSYPYRVEAIVPESVTVVRTLHGRLCIRP